MKKSIFIAFMTILMLNDLVSFASIIGPPPTTVEVKGYPFTVILKGDGTETQKCGDDMELNCFVVITYTGTIGVYDIGSRISIFRDGLNNEKGLVDALLTSPLNLQNNPVEINYKKDSQTFITNDYNSFETEFINRYGN